MHFSLLVFSRGYKYEPEVGNGFHDILLMANELENFEILNIKDVDYRCAPPRLKLTLSW